MSLQTICLFEQDAKRLLYLEEAQENCLLKIEQKQELVGLYTKLVQSFDCVDPGLKYYFMKKLQQLVIRGTLPSSIMSQESIISKLKKNQSSFITKSLISANKSGGSFLKKDKSSITGSTNNEIEDAGTVIQNQFKILQQMQEQKQETIKSSLSNQQSSIAKRLKDRKQKTRRKSFQKPSQKSTSPLLNKDDLKRMQKDLTKRLKRATARLSKIEALKAFSQKLTQNPFELQQLRKQIFDDKIVEQDQGSDTDN